MSIRYNSEWYVPALGPQDQIDKFWEQNKLPIKYVGNDKCVYFQESIGDIDESAIVQESVDFPDIVFYGLIHSKIDMSYWWTNVIVKNGEWIITNEVPGDGERGSVPVWCNGLTALFPDDGYIIPDYYKSLYINMPKDQSDNPPPKKKENYGIYF